MVSTSTWKRHHSRLSKPLSVPIQDIAERGHEMPLLSLAQFRGRLIHIKDQILPFTFCFHPVSIQLQLPHLLLLQQSTSPSTSSLSNQFKNLTSTPCVSQESLELWLSSTLSKQQSSAMDFPPALAANPQREDLDHLRLRTMPLFPSVVKAKTRTKRRRNLRRTIPLPGLGRMSWPLSTPTTSSSAPSGQPSSSAFLSSREMNQS